MAILNDTDGFTLSTERLIPIRDVADRLGFSARWVREQIIENDLPAHRIDANGPYRFRWSEIEDWLEECARIIERGERCECARDDGNDEGRG